MGYKWFKRLIVGLTLFTCSSLRAGTINVTLVSSTLTGTPGDVITFQGSLNNNSGTDMFINGAGISLAGFGPADSDITGFILNATGLLSNGSSLGPVGLFTVTIPAQFSTGQYAGILSIQGGPTPNDDLLQGTTGFQVNVSSVPEPSSFSLSATTVLLALFLRRFLRPSSRKVLRPVR